MLKCAIPRCDSRERFLRSGTLHLIDIVREDGSMAKRMVWLCAGCSSQYTVQTWRIPGEQIRLRNRDSVFDLAEMLSPQTMRCALGSMRRTRELRHTAESLVAKHHCAVPQKHSTRATLG